MMRLRFRPIVAVAAAQYLAVLLGWTTGFAHLRHARGGPFYPAFLLPWPMSAGLAVIAFYFEAIHYLMWTRLRTAHPRVAAVALAIAIWATFLMATDQLCECDTDGGFVLGICLLLPFLFAVNIFVRSKSWLGTVAVILFFATCLAMLVYNGGAWREGRAGFFYHEVW